MYADHIFGGFIGIILGTVIGVILMASRTGQYMEDADICKRTIQYQLDKTPEEVHTLIQTERKREGR